MGEVVSLGWAWLDYAKQNAVYGELQNGVKVKLSVEQPGAYTVVDTRGGREQLCYTGTLMNPGRSNGRCVEIGTLVFVEVHVPLTHLASSKQINAENFDTLSPCSVDIT